MGRKNADEADERTALLADHHAAAGDRQPGFVDEHTEQPFPAAAAAATGDTTDAKLPRRSVAIFMMCCVCVFFLMLGVGIMAPASSQVLEENICKSYHPDISNGNDPRCKKKDVQRELSLIDGWAIPLTLLPGIMTAVAYGMMADLYGRRLGIGLCMLGLLLQQGSVLVIFAFPNVFPMRAVWFTSLLTFIGGGATVLNAHIYSIISDVAPKAHKTVLFSYFSASLTAAELIGSPLAWAITESGAWLALGTGSTLIVLSAVCAVLIPDVRTEVKTGDVPCDIVSDTLDGPSANPFSSAWSKVKHFLRSQFLEQKTLGLLLASCLFTTFGEVFVSVLAQYVGQRFHWTWSETGLLRGLRGGITMATTSLIIPFLDRLLRLKWSWALFDKDIFLLQLSLVIMAIALLGLGLASTSAVMLAFLSLYSLSRGHESMLRSLLAQAAGEDKVGTVYTTTSMLETGGMAIAGPLLAATYRKGLNLGGLWVGLPFFVGTGLVVSGSCLVWAASKTACVDFQSRDGSPAETNATEPTM